jgi:hypothetical protein
MPQRARRVVALKNDVAGIEDADAFESNVAEFRNQRAGSLRRRGIERVHLDHVLRAANADVLVFDVAHQSPTARVRLDAESVVGALDRKIEHPNGARTAIGFTPDGDAVAAIEMIVRDRDVGARASAARLIAMLSSPVLM